MEKILSMEDRIRKAEEIYNRRNNIKEQNIYTRKDKSSFKIMLIKKITTQTLVSACIFTGIFTLLNNEKYSYHTKENVNQVLQYNIDFNGIYSKFINNKESTVETNVEIEEIKQEENIEIERQEVKEEVLGEQDVVKTEEPKIVDAMEVNAQYIKENISLIKPLEGEITSRYGQRENVKPLFHTGIDIAANTGTKIASAMDGIAKIVSEDGSYGKHIKIVNGEIATVYAHCNDLFIKEGESVKQGDIIAEVGSTRQFNGSAFAF